MANKKSKGKGSYLNYVSNSSLTKNRNKRIARHLKKFVNDLQAAAALKKPKTPRKASKRTQANHVSLVFVRDAAGHKHYAKY